MLTKGPDEEYAVDTVAKAIRYRIFLYGVRQPSFTDATFCNACTNHYYGVREKYGTRGQYRHCLDVVAKPQRQSYPQGIRLIFDAAAPRGGDCVIDLVQSGGKLRNWYLHTDLSDSKAIRCRRGPYGVCLLVSISPDTPLKLKSIAEHH